jgi:predicted  nucleic acid-binding Zn-ribbon protein
VTRWDALLAVQEHDTHIDQLLHRRSHLPERSELEQVMAGLSALDAAAAEVEENRHALVRDQQRLADEVQTLNDKIEHHDKTLYGGSISNPRELQALQDEIASVRRRVSQLEDRELELMEQIEPLDAELASMEERRAALDEQAAGLRARIAEGEVVIDADLERARGERSTLVGGVDADLLEEYERLRARLGGIAIARLVGGSCGGCHLTLAAVDLDRIKKLPPDAPAHCEECGRLLAR